MYRALVQSACRLLVAAGISIAIILSAFSATGQANADSKQGYNQLVFGFLPMESPVSLFKRFAPFRDYLSTLLEKDVRIETAPDFNEYARRTAQRRYDIVFTAPHMALSALDGDHYEPAATFTEQLTAVIVVKQNSSIQNVVELNSKTIATPPNEAIVTMVGKHFLSSSGAATPHYKQYRTHNAAYSAVLGGEVDAAIIANFIYKKVRAKNASLKFLAESDGFPGVGILVAKDLPEELKANIKKVIIDMKDLPHGKAVLRSIAQPGYGEAAKSQFETLRPYINTSFKQ